MVALSASLTKAFGVASDIADADNDGASASAQAAAPISKKRFMKRVSLGGFCAAGREVSRMEKVPLMRVTEYVFAMTPCAALSPNASRIELAGSRPSKSQAVRSRDRAGRAEF